MATVVAICIGMAAGGALVTAAGVLDMLCEAFLRIRRSRGWALMRETIQIWRAIL